MDALVEHPRPALRPRERLDQRAIGLWLAAEHDGAPVGSDDALAAAAKAKPV
jgi:hypothetical protein